MKKTIESKSKKKIKVIFATAEAEPFSKTGGLGDVGGSLPVALSKSGVEVSVVLPNYSNIPSEYKSQMTLIGEINVVLAWRNLYCGVLHLKHSGINYYFIDNEFYFKREGFYGYGDDAERFAFFSKAILASLPTIYKKTPPDILHCNDWHTALSSVYLREEFIENDFFKDIKLVYTVHNLKFQGIFPKYVLGDVLGLGNCESASTQLSNGDIVNFMKGALSYSDRITTVSPTYAEEIKNPFFGETLDNIFRDRSSVLRGIINGIDTTKHNPRKNENIYLNYGITTIKKKLENKLKLQEELGLVVGADFPLIVIVSRLTSQKGFDLINRIIDEFLDTTDAQLAILGTGDNECEQKLKEVSSRFQGRMSLNLSFDLILADKMYAAGDMFLMPSLFEPCGLSQMMSMSYGNLPIVRETGGLADTVLPYNEVSKEGTGFSFTNYNAHDLLYTLKNAVNLYKNDKPVWKQLQINAMRTDFSWKNSAKSYVELYKDLLL